MVDRNVIIKGEGGANVVMQYKNSKNAPQVIRLRKSCLNKEGELPKPKGIDELIWPELLEQGTNLLSLQSDLKYSKQILAPLIGPQYIPSQELINLDKEESQIYGASQGVLMPDVTLLSPSLPPSSSQQPQQQHPPTICIEIKPKFGSITKCSTVHPEDITLKHSTSRHQLHQLLKHRQGTIDTVSNYDPLDLFSGETDRIKTALYSLLENPQNNLNIFINGEPIDLNPSTTNHLGESGENQASWIVVERALATAATILGLPLESHFFSDNSGINTTTTTTAAATTKHAFVKVLCQILQQEPVLQNISTAQQACRFDIVGIYHLYQEMLKKMHDSCEETDTTTALETKEEEETSPVVGPAQERMITNTNNDLSLIDKVVVSEVNNLHKDALDAIVKLPWTESIKTIQSYIIATTAKDCSIMITMCSSGSSSNDSTSKGGSEDGRAKLQTESENGTVVIFCEKEKLNDDGKETTEPRPCSHCVDYRISVVDLDRKSTLKIPEHYKLDQQIIKAAKNAMT